VDHVLNELPSESHDMIRDLLDAMCPRSPEPVAVHAQRLHHALAPLIIASYDDAPSRLEDLSALVVACAEATRLSDVAAEQALEPPVSTGDLAGPPLVDEDWLVLSTIHSAKGLEFDAVHVIHAADGFIPSDMALGTPEGLEEERRLFYVAVTRARRNLSIYVPLRYHHHRGGDDHSWAQPSRFLSDDVRTALGEVPFANPGDQACSPTPTVTINGAAIVAGRLSELW